jgi:hypothetical protein
VQPMLDLAFGEQCPDRRGVVALRGAEQSDCAGPLADRTGQIRERGQCPLRPFSATPAKAGGQEPKAWCQTALDLRLRGDDE